MRRDTSIWANVDRIGGVCRNRRIERDMLVSDSMANISVWLASYPLSISPIETIGLAVEYYGVTRNTSPMNTSGA